MEHTAVIKYTVEITRRVEVVGHTPEGTLVYRAVDDLDPDVLSADSHSFEVRDDIDMVPMADDLMTAEELAIVKPVATD